MQNDFSIRSGRGRLSSTTLPQLNVIEDFTVEGDPSETISLDMGWPPPAMSTMLSPAFANPTPALVYTLCASTAVVDGADHLLQTPGNTPARQSFRIPAIPHMLVLVR